LGIIVNMTTSIYDIEATSPHDNDILHIHKQRCDQLLKIQNQAYKLFEKKNKDYGDAFAKYGTIGVLMRIGDKISRLMSIDSNKIHLVDDETLHDTLIDLHNYSAMALMLMQE